MPNRRYLIELLFLACLLTGCQQGGVSEQSGVDRERLAQANAQLGFQYLQEGEYNTALQKLNKALEAVPDHVDAHNAMGLLRTRLGQYDEAEKSFKRALNGDPNNSSARNNYGQFLCQRKRYDEGQAQFLKAVENPLYKTPAVAYSNAGSCAIDAGDTATAEEHFRAALKFNPTLAPALIQLSELNYQRGHYLPARAYFQRFAAVSRPSARALWLGILIERELGDKDAVSSYALQLEKNFPDSVETGLWLDSKAQ